MLLRYLKNVTLKKGTKGRASNGNPVETYEEVSKHKVQIQELDDEISASVYGASIINMYRIKTPLGGLESFLRQKVNNKQDNISQYYIFINNDKYRIKSVNSKGIEIELVWKI